MDNPNPNPNPSPKLTPIPEQDPQLLWISRATSKSRYMVDEASRFEMLGVSLGVPITVLDVESYSLRKVAMLVQGVRVRVRVRVIHSSCGSCSGIGPGGG